MSRYALVIFDLDNTLVNTRPAAKEAYRQAIYYLAKQHHLDNQKDKLYNHWKRLVQSVIGENKPHLRRFAHSLNLLLAAHKLPDTYAPQTLKIYEKVLLEELKPLAGAKDLLESLQEHKIKIAIATGSDRAEAIKKLKTVNLWKLIDLLVSSTDVDTMKPDPAFYQNILSETKIPLKKTCVVGDNQAEDLDPALKLKIATILVSSKTQNLVALKSQLLE